MRASAPARLAARLSDLAGAPVVLERPSDPAHGDYATNVALRTAPQHRRPPKELAAELAERAAALEEVERAEVAGPGFLNLWVTPAWLAEALGEIGPDYGAGTPERRQKIQVELISANPAGPLTVGSARNGAYGDSVARLLSHAGHEVEREYYFNDAGRQVELFRASVEARRRGEEPPEGGYQGEYINELAARDVDPVQYMLGEIRREVAEFRIAIDSWRHQGEIEQEVAGVLPKLDSYEAAGTTWARTSEYGDDKDRPLIRSEDGSYLYFAADVAYVRDKLERGFDRAIYVLGADHHGYVGRLKAAAAMLGYDPERIEVLIYQLVHIVEGGQTKKISKRRGDVVFLHELIDKIGVDATRWYLVSRGHDQPIDIDVDLAAERTQKNPVYYVQYAHARIAGILRNAEGEHGGTPSELEKEERDLIKRLLEFPGVAAEAAERRAPHAIPIYAIRVADDFHRFYHEHRVVGSETEAFRLALVRATQSVIAHCLDLIGVAAPERM
ncbi:MAG: arginine--tRNA ligase [Actinobacteria bacterium]|nr:MAG: arginine--tRNA ligase [Actinomycetota bacterium]